MEWKNIIGGIALLLLGTLIVTEGKVDVSSSAINNITINREEPANFKKNEKNSKEININTAHKYDLMELQGIGEKKASKIIGNRPYKHKYELKERGILGYYTYNKNKDFFKVGD